MKLCSRCKKELQKIFDALDEEAREALVKGLEALKDK